MYLARRIKEPREQNPLFQRQLAAKLEIDKPICSKIKRHAIKAERKQGIKLAGRFQVREVEVLTRWIAYHIYKLTKDQELGKKAIEFISNKI